LCLATYAAHTALAADDDWPEEIEAKLRRVVMYQPQPTKPTNNALVIMRTTLQALPIDLFNAASQVTAYPQTGRRNAEPKV